MTPVEQLQADVLGPRYKDKRTLMEFEIAAQPPTGGWYGTLTAFLIWEKPSDTSK